MSRLTPSGHIQSTENSRFALFNLAFRPFFLAGAIFSIFAVMIWVHLITGKLQLSLYGGAIWWHIHEMLFGFIVAIVVGFLLTAVQNWSGIPGLSGTGLIALFSIWLTARLAMFFPEFLGNSIIFILDLLFLPCAAIALAYPIIKTKLWRNLIFIPILLLMASANYSFHSIALEQDYKQLTATSNFMIILVVLVMCVLGGRVFPMFTANGTLTPRVAAIPSLEIASILSVIVVLIMNVWLINPEEGLSGAFIANSSLSASSNNQSWFVASIYFATAAIHMIRVFRWKIWVTFKTPLVWSLHLSYWCIVIGFLLLGLAELFDSVTKSQAIHALTIGAMSGMILAMISRVSLGHTGRTIKVGKLMTIGFIAIFVGFIIRVFGLYLSIQYLTVLFLTAACWSVAFGCFVWRYTRILSSPRLDGKPG